MRLAEPGSGVAYARAALAGNPSDGYGGAVLAVAFSDHRAQAQARPARRLAVSPRSPLVRATVSRFARELAPPARATAVQWSTSIPRSVGLGGSSAIVIATLRALCDLHDVKLSRPQMAAFALAVETEELGIAAGLQDRVAQTYGGLTFMDFAPEASAEPYEQLDPQLLPPLLVAWRATAAEDSGGVHSSLRARYERGEPAVRHALSELGSLAREARAALLAGDPAALTRCADASFDTRRRMMALDARHVEMVERARAAGASANYAGSGGAIVCLCQDDQHREAVNAALGAIACHAVAPTVEAGREA